MLEIQTILFLWCLLVNKNGVKGAQLSNEDLEAEYQLKLLNPKAIKTIKTINGDIYNCVDFYKQPAFSHSALENHGLQSKVKHSTHRGKNIQQDYLPGFNPHSIWMNGKGCPVGTVPIRKTTKDDLVRAKLASETHATKIVPQTSEIPGLHFAILRTKFNANEKYHGASMVSSIYNPHVQNSQSSYGRMRVQNGADHIEVGWTVNPTLCKDNKTRMYIYTDAGPSRCFNMFCHGWVQLSSEIPVDYLFDPYTTPGGLTVAENFMLDHDTSVGIWYLKVGENGTIVGRWTHDVFATGLNDFASYIDWGGQVYGPPSIASAPMGSGLEFEGVENYNAYCMRISVANETHYRDVDNAEMFQDTNAYFATDEVPWNHYDARRFVVYGGHGGHIGN